jgi:hypothetical protein
MGRDRVPRRRRRDVAKLPPPEPDTAERRNPLYRIELSAGVRNALTRNVAVDVEVCATGEPCAQAAHCGSQAHVKVVAHEDELMTQALCADDWLAIRALYVARSGSRLNYGPGALNMISMRRTPHPSDGDDVGQ